METNDAPRRYIELGPHGRFTIIAKFSTIVGIFLQLNLPRTARNRTLLVSEHCQQRYAAGAKRSFAVRPKLCRAENWAGR